MPTKIQEFDLSIKLRNTFQSLWNVQGSYSSLEERLKNINSDLFDEDTKAVINDLIAAHNDTSKHVAERLVELEEATNYINLDSMEMGSFNEIFSYTDGNVTQHKVTGDRNFTVDYAYKTDGSGELDTSTKTFTLDDGSTIEINKTYTYTDGDITGISTSTNVIPATT